MRTSLTALMLAAHLPMRPRLPNWCVLHAEVRQVLQSPWQLLSLPLKSDCCAAGHQTSKIKKELLAYLTQEWDHKVQKLLSYSLACPSVQAFPRATDCLTCISVKVSSAFRQWPI